MSRSPYEKNQILTVTITDLGSEGEGIGKVDGFPFFVKGAVPGDVAEIKVTKTAARMAYARVECLLGSSPNRIDPLCEVAGPCGGCNLQHYSYEGQLAFKQNKVKNNLMRIGGIEKEYLEKIMEPIIGMNDPGEEPWHYRNKAQVPFGKNREGKTICGFYAGRTHSIIPQTTCALGVPENEAVLDAVLKYMEECGAAPYDEESGKGLIRHVLIRKSRAYGQLMVCLVINGKKLPGQEHLIERLRGVPGMYSVSISVNREKTNVIMGSSYETIWGEATIEDRICLCEETKETARDGTETTLWKETENGGVIYRISPLSFYQVNPVQTQKLYSTALRYADLKGEETVWDLYCGIGTISLFLAGKAGKVYGVEIVPQAIEDAWANARRNGIENAEFFTGAAEVVLPAFYEKHRNDTSVHPDVIVVDPPRKGCDKACLDTMILMQPERIVYVSCDSATLARDVKYLEVRGYHLIKVRACDMFPQTTHVETVCLMSRVEGK